MAIDISSFVEDPKATFEQGFGDIQVSGEENPIDRMIPGSDFHKEILDKVVSRIEFSEDYMQDFYSRWRINEMKIQAYINLPDWEQQLKNLNDSAEPPHPVRVIVPFGYAALSTMTTFLIHTFAGRRPMFQLGTNKAEYVNSARNMELVLQYNADHTRLVRHLWQHFNDIGIYGLGVWKTDWEVKRAMRTIRQVVPQYMGPSSEAYMGSVKRRERRVVYEGNSVEAIDPFMFLPDPRVSMSAVNRKGEFVFWRSFQSKMMLKSLEKDDGYKWTKDIDKTLPRTRYSQDSLRALISRGTAFPGSGEGRDSRRQSSLQNDFVQVDQGTIRLVPKEWKLGDSEDVELWQFTVGNKNQIIQIEQYSCDHDMHPVCVSEPYGFGYAFGQPGPADFIGPLQDLITWLVNSHIDNVRAVLNDMWVVDPSRIEMKDLDKSGPGHRIRLKPSAYGSDVRASIMQLPIQDVTARHLDNAELFMRMGMLLLGLNENIMGQPDSGGRKTATESRQSAEAAVSRLAQTARIISAHSMTDLTEQMVLNNQQHLSDEFYVQIVGQEEGKILQPGDIAGDFYYPIHDGTLPLDRVALVEVWKDILAGVSGDPVLNQQYDTGKIFEFAAKLGGATNIEGMRRTPQQQADVAIQSQGSIDEGVRQGNLAPASFLSGLG